MSLGATMSAPASAWLAAVCASSFQRRIVQNFPAVHHDAAMAVLHVFAQAHVRDDQQRRQFLFQQPHRLLDDAVLGVSAGSLRVFFVGNAEEQNGRHAERVGRAASRKISSGESWKTPGMASMARRNLRPLRANSGRTSCSTLKRVSQTSRRSAGDCRSRRGHPSGSSVLRPAWVTVRSAAGGLPSARSTRPPPGHPGARKHSVPNRVHSVGDDLWLARPSGSASNLSQTPGLVESP
jgi:hypothetical protein